MGRGPVEVADDEGTGTGPALGAVLTGVGPDEADGVVAGMVGMGIVEVEAGALIVGNFPSTPPWCFT